MTRFHFTKYSSHTLTLSGANYSVCNTEVAYPELVFAILNENYKGNNTMCTLNEMGHI